MKIMDCPLNGPRNISEFACRGEVKTMPDPDKASDRDWADYLFMQTNAAGVVREWWIHLPSSYWFIAERDTRTGEIVKTFPPDELFKRPNRKLGGS